MVNGNIAPHSNNFNGILNNGIKPLQKKVSIDNKTKDTPFKGGK